MSALVWAAWAVLTAVNIGLWVASLRNLNESRDLLDDATAALTERGQG